MHNPAVSDPVVLYWLPIHLSHMSQNAKEHVQHSLANRNNQATGQELINAHPRVMRGFLRSDGVGSITIKGGNIHFSPTPFLCLPSVRHWYAHLGILETFWALSSLARQIAAWHFHILILIVITQALLSLLFLLGLHIDR